VPVDEPGTGAFPAGTQPPQSALSGVPVRLRRAAGRAARLVHERNAMTPEHFWQVVDGVAAPDTEQVAEALDRVLGTLDADALVGYEERFLAEMARSNTYRHHAAAEVIMGFTSEDVFTDFRTWVLYQGHEVYDAFVADPDSLAGRGPVDDEQVGMAEELEFLPQERWGRLTGRDPFGDDSHWPCEPWVDAEPTGRPLDADERSVGFPRLRAVYVGGPASEPAPITPR
jgi:hypothetical protein